MKTYKLIATAMLSALAFVFQLTNNFIGIPTGFGMTVDLAAFPVLLAFLILGVEYGISSLMMLGLLILLSSPTGFIGAIMKVSATLPMILVPFAIAKSKGINLAKTLLLIFVFILLFFYASAFFSQFHPIIPALFLLGIALLSTRIKGDVKLDGATILLLSLAVAILVRGIAMIIANIYFAGPMFFHMSTEQFLSFLQSIELPFLGKNWAYMVIFFWNAVQGAVEFGLAWLFAYPFGLRKKYGE
jgi:riboflavin transporter FmnP